MRTHTLQNGNVFHSSAFPEQEGEAGGEVESGAAESGDTIVLANGNVFKSSAFPAQDEPEAEKPAKRKSRKTPTWDLKETPEEYLKASGLNATHSALALATLGLSREEYEELGAPNPPTE